LRGVPVQKTTAKLFLGQRGPQFYFLTGKESGDTILIIEVAEPHPTETDPSLRQNKPKTPSFSKATQGERYNTEPKYIHPEVGEKNKQQP